MSDKVNNSISVDCVVFGFNGTSLKVLLIDREYSCNGKTITDRKLPGRMIFESDTLSVSAHKLLVDMTGLKDVELRQLHIFSDPNRITKEELEWINKFHNTKSDRVVTVAYYGLVKLNNRIVAQTVGHGGYWVDIDSIRQLAMDHKEILLKALSTLCKELIYSPIAFQVLPKKFTIKELQTLYSSILGTQIDNRNFRKKVLGTGLLIPTGEKEQSVSHKPAQYYMFDRKAYDKSVKEKLKLRFISNWRY